jgi:hypothetical protein
MKTLWRLDLRCWSIGMTMQTVRGIDEQYRFWLGLHFLCWSVAILLRTWPTQAEPQELGLDEPEGRRKR